MRNYSNDPSEKLRGRTWKVIRRWKGRSVEAKSRNKRRECNEEGCEKWRQSQKIPCSWGRFCYQICCFRGNFSTFRTFLLLPNQLKLIRSQSFENKISTTRSKMREFSAKLRIKLDSCRLMTHTRLGRQHKSWVCQSSHEQGTSSHTFYCPYLRESSLHFSGSRLLLVLHTRCSCRKGGNLPCDWMSEVTRQKMFSCTYGPLPGKIVGKHEFSFSWLQDWQCTSKAVWVQR